MKIPSRGGGKRRKKKKVKDSLGYLFNFTS